MEMAARQEEGIAFMAGSAAHWAQEDNVFAVHLWWHTTLFHLDQGDVRWALEIYDRAIRPAPGAVQVTLLDAAARRRNCCAPSNRPRKGRAPMPPWSARSAWRWCAPSPLSGVAITLNAPN
jgi:hypothetical protein